jgi:3-oxoacyl-[acyl-carrier protein] reductase
MKGLEIMSKFTGKVAVVTGASKGLGAEIAKSLAKEDASVIVNYASSKAGADAVVASITAAGGAAVAVQADVSKEADAKGLIDAAVTTFGGVDILVNNAGIYDEYAPIGEISEELYRRQFDINVLGTVMMMKHASHHLKAGSCIINISTVGVSVHLPTTAIYAGSKGAVNVISGVVAKELAPRGIRVNVINSGYVRTEGNHAAGIVGSRIEADFIAQTPLGRAGEPDDIADVVTFLASDDARFITGEAINVSGGIY